MFTKGAWNADDEMEYLRQEQLRVEKRHENAFKEGFGLGAVWGITNGVKALAEPLGSVFGSHLRRLLPGG